MDKMREHQLQWFGHVMRQGDEDLVTAMQAEMHKKVDGEGRV